MSRPILVTGSHRSGTTWAGRMLCQSGEAAYVHEPFNPNRSPGWIPTPPPYWFVHITDDNAASYEPWVRRLIQHRYPLFRSLARARRPRRFVEIGGEWIGSLRAKVGRRRTLIKDPMALFGAEWLARTFEIDVLVMIRHPAAFISSIVKLNWGFDYEQQWLAQPSLMRDLLGPFEDDFRGYQGEVDLVGEGIVIWRALHHAIAELRDRHPDWAFVRHEDLSEDPVGGFRHLYDGFGLTWDARVEGRIRHFSDPGNVAEVRHARRRAIRRDSRKTKKVWLDRLSPADIERIRAETADVAGLFYSDEDWAPQPSLER